MDDMVLLCDVDHGLVHELELGMTRRDGRLVVLTPDGRRIWGAADAAFTGGVGGLDTEPFVGVHPIGDTVARRPAVHSLAPAAGTVEEANTRMEPADGSGADAMRLLPFPGGAPPLADAMHAKWERVNMDYVVGVLMGNRDLERRLAAEAKGTFSLAA